MKYKLNIVCHAFPSWRGDYMKSTVQLMKELALEHKVLYVDYSYSWKDILINTRHNKFIPVKRILGIENPIETVDLDPENKIYILSLPPIIPFNWAKNEMAFNFIQKINNFIIRKRIKSALKKLEMEKPVLINAFNPFWVKYSVSQFNPKASIYYCYDNITASAWASKHGSRLENEIKKKVNAVVYSSQELKASNKGTNTPAYVVNNGVDLSIFEKHIKLKTTLDNSTEVHIGYVGSIDNRLDYDLLEKTIIRFPEWTFHFIGRINSTEVERLKKYTNTIFYGAVHVGELPVLMKYFSAGIIPFVKNDFTKNIYPMKVNEYLAMGMPAIMTDFAIIDDLSGMVKVSDKANFSDALISEIKTNSVEKVNSRIHFALQNSWKNKAKEFENILLQYAS